MELDELCSDLLLRRSGCYPKVAHRSDAGLALAPRGHISRGAAAESSRCAAPAFPYTEGLTVGDSPAAVYWAWFQKAMGRQLLLRAEAAGVGSSKLLSEPTAAGVIRVCREDFGKPLSEIEEAHLAQVPVTAKWIQQALGQSK
mmetsp:Transcript_16589/g.29030  ORF Transcript_16589/g.29030 Transcript_16589/m.29030 type:complete len:143 (-) Transcript_16589:88-516(-)